MKNTLDTQSEMLEETIPMTPAQMLNICDDIDEDDDRLQLALTPVAQVCMG